MATLKYDGQVVVITGAGAGLGKEYALFFASRGAKVVVNDFVHSPIGQNSPAADAVVSEIRAAGGTAVANYDRVEHGDGIIATAINYFGRIDVLINNAGILRDVAFENMTDEDWDAVMAVHVTGPYKCTRAAWPYFRKQKYGRAIITSSVAGLFGAVGQVNYSAAKLAQVGFGKTLAKEGRKYNILVNTIAPVTTSGTASSTAYTPIPAHTLVNLSPDRVVPLVAFLTHASNTNETGSIFEAGGGHFAKLRWQRSEGALMKPDETFTAGTVLDNWTKITDFSRGSQYPDAAVDAMEMPRKTTAQPPNPSSKPLDFKDRVVLITGGSAGLGRQYCLLFAKLGAKVVVNDLVDPQPIVREIQKQGGIAIGVQASAEDGEKVVAACIDNFGRIDIVINNAGILRDRAFTNMTDELWNPIMAVHLRATYKVSRAAWPHMIRQRYGRIINTTSTSGIYGNFGQANYSAAKSGVLGFSYALAQEGAKHNIYVNCIAPTAGTQLTRSVMTEDIVQALKPDYVAPLVAVLCSEKASTGGLYEVGSGWAAKTRWQRSVGHQFTTDKEPTPETVLQFFTKICDFDDNRADYPHSCKDGLKLVMASAGKRSMTHLGTLNRIQTAKEAPGRTCQFTYDDRDVILYNLGVGATKADLSLVFEGSGNFQALPTFGTVSQYFTEASYTLADLLPNYNPTMLLHGEQYLEVLQYPIPTKATLVSTQKLIEVVDKGKAALVRSGITSIDAATGKPVFYQESTVFVRNAGGFGGPNTVPDRGAATAENKAPPRRPDFVREEKTSEDQAVLYRLSGDRNHLHVDPALSAAGGFPVPILHGLCFFGISGKHVYEKYGAPKTIKVRFVGTVLPGQTLVTEMWKEGGTIIYQVRVKETGKLCIANAAVELRHGNKSLLVDGRKIGGRGKFDKTM